MVIKLNGFKFAALRALHARQRVLVPQRVISFTTGGGILPMDFYEASILPILSERLAF